MKHTKKMVMIPESEYHSLLSMFKSGGDPLKMEKAQTDARVQKTLADPKLSEDIKAKKYNWLYKKRRQLKSALENRPQKMVIEKAQKPVDMPPYISGTTRAPKPRIKEETTEFETAVEEIGNEEKKHVKKTRRQTATPKGSSPFKGIIPPKYANRIESLVEKNKTFFRIYDNGQFESNIKGKLIKESNYHDVLDYLTGQRDTPPKGFRFLAERLRKDDEMNAMMKGKSTGESSSESYSGASGSRSGSSTDKQQSGSGRKRHVIAKAPAAILNKSTKGLKRVTNIRKNLFKPKLWEKLE